MTDFKHTPPNARPSDLPVRSIVINELWAQHMQGLFSPATSEQYWASDTVQARDDAIGIEAIIAVGDSTLFPVQHCHIRRTTNQSITSGVLTTVSFDTEVEDVGDMFDIASPDRIQLTEPGVYLCGGQVRWQANAVGQRLVIPVASISAGFVSDERLPGASKFDHPFTGKFIVGAAEFVRMKVSQSSGITLTIQPLSVRSIDFWVHYLGPL